MMTHRRRWFAFLGALAVTACERSATVAAPVVRQLRVEQGGTLQTAPVRRPVPIAPSVRVLDGEGRPVVGTRVVFLATKGSGSVQPSTTITTDANGVAATTSWTLGGLAGAQQLTAVIADATADLRVAFDANATPGAPATIDVGAGFGSRMVGDTFTVRATLRDADGNATSGAALTYMSSVPAVAAVNGVGLVTVLAPGATVITVSSASLSATFSLTVTARPSTLSLTSTAISGAAYGVAIASTNVAYATQLDTRLATRFALPSEAVAGTVAGSGSSLDVSFLPDGSRAYLASASSVIVVNTTTHSAIDTIPIAGTAYRVLASADGRYVYATTNNGLIARITVASRAVTNLETNGEPINGIALHTTRPVLLATSVNGSLYEVDLATFTLTRTLTIGGTPQGLSVAPDGSRVFIASESSDLDVRNGATLARIATATTGQGAFDVKVTPNGLYLIISRTGRVAVLDASSFAQYQTFPANVPRRIAINAAGTIVMVGTLGQAVLFLK